MSDWPSSHLQPPDIITPWSAEAMGRAIQGGVSATPGSGPIIANLAYYIPFFLTEGRTALKMLHMNGAAVAGNIDLGIYDWEFDAVVTLGATAQAGTNAVQEGDIADTVLPPGRYFMAFSASSGSGTSFAVAAASDENAVPQWGHYTQASAHPLPTGTATPVKTTQSAPNIPLFGVSFRSLI